MLINLKLTHKKAIFFFVAVCLISTLAVAFHHHDDENPHFDCPVCVAGNSFSSAVIENNTSFEFHSIVTGFQKPEEALLKVLSTFFTYPNRAPPFLNF